MGGTPNRNSTAAGGMPLAFTQEDFLVQHSCKEIILRIVVKQKKDPIFEI